MTRLGLDPGLYPDSEGEWMGMYRELHAKPRVRPPIVEPMDRPFVLFAAIVIVGAFLFGVALGWGVRG